MKPGGQWVFEMTDKNSSSTRKNDSRRKCLPALKGYSIFIWRNKTLSVSVFCCSGVQGEPYRVSSYYFEYFWEIKSHLQILQRTEHSDLQDKQTAFPFLLFSGSFFFFFFLHGTSWVAKPNKMISLPFQISRQASGSSTSGISQKQEDLNLGFIS